MTVPVPDEEQASILAVIYIDVQSFEHIYGYESPLDNPIWPVWSPTRSIFVPDNHGSADARIFIA